MARILIVEDDASIRAGLEEILRREGHEVATARDGPSGLEQGRRPDLDLLLLDLKLPRMDGIEVCRRLRAAGAKIPILMLTARAQEADKVLGLDVGADDYMTKPFGIAELAARIKALLRRVPGPDAAPASIEFGAARADFERHKAFRAGKEVPLTAREFALLRHFAAHPGRVLTRDDLLRDVWGYDTPPVTRTVDAHVAALRKKLEKNPARPRHLKSLRNVGYVFEP